LVESGSVEVPIVAFTNGVNVPAIDELAWSEYISPTIGVDDPTDENMTGCHR